jgi:hypothetical protein
MQADGTERWDDEMQGGSAGSPERSPERWYDKMAGVIVAVAGLLVLLGIVLIAISELPSGANKGSNIVAIASAGFGVLGAIVGAYFGVRAANRAVTKMSETKGQEPG